MKWQRKHKRDGQQRRRKFRSRRPLAYTDSDSTNKRICRKIERAQFKHETYKEKRNEHHEKGTAND